MKQELSQPKSPSKKLSQKQEEAITFFRKLQMGDLCFLDIIQYGFALFGLTKAGKTTLAHLLVRNPLIGVQKQTGQICYEASRQITRLKEAVIGQTRQSQTQVPNQCIFYVHQQNNQNLRVHILDCPGYEDTNGCNMLIANGYFHYRIFSKVRRIKFLLTFDYDQFRGIFQRPKATLIEFFSSFKNYGEIKQQIKAATVFVFTKVERKQPLNQQLVTKNIIEKLKSMRDCSNVHNSQYRDFTKDLINNIIQGQKPKLFIFYKAVKDRQPSTSEDFLQKIHQRTSFWTRQLIFSSREKLVDVSQIQMTLGRRIRLRAQSQNSFKDQFINLMGVFGQRFKQAFLQRENMAGSLSIQTVLSCFLEDSLKGLPQAKQFYKYVKNFNAQFNIYNSPISLSSNYVEKRKIIQDNFLSDKIQEIDKKGVLWIQKLQISNLIISMIKRQDLMASQGSRTVAKFHSISQAIVKSISQFKKINYSDKSPQYLAELKKFSYIVYRLLEEAKTFKIIFGTDFQASEGSQINKLFTRWVDTTQVIIDFIQSLSGQAYDIAEWQGFGPLDFQKIKINYFNKHFQVLTRNKQLSYFLQIQQYYKECNLLQNKVLSDNLVQLTTIKLKINRPKMKRNEIIYSLLQKIKIIKRKLIQKEQFPEIEAYIQVINQLGQELSRNDKNQHPDKQSLRYAIEFFKLSRNVYKVLSTYTELISKQKEVQNAVQLKGILLQYGQYASTHGRKQLAIQVYQRAYSLIERCYLSNPENNNDYLKKRNQERQRINRMIGRLGIQKKYDPSQSYYDDLMRKKYHDLIEDQFIEKTQIKFGNIK